jgi:hypothetical protein
MAATNTMGTSVRTVVRSSATGIAREWVYCNMYRYMQVSHVRRRHSALRVVWHSAARTAVCALCVCGMYRLLQPAPAWCLAMGNVGHNRCHALWCRAHALPPPSPQDPPLCVVTPAPCSVTRVYHVPALVLWTDAHHAASHSTDLLRAEWRDVQRLQAGTALHAARMRWCAATAEQLMAAIECGDRNDDGLLQVG